MTFNGKNMLNKVKGASLNGGGNKFISSLSTIIIVGWLTGFTIEVRFVSFVVTQELFDGSNSSFKD